MLNGFNKSFRIGLESVKVFSTNQSTKHSNEFIDKWIQKAQLNAGSYKEVLEWTPYDKFEDIKKIKDINGNVFGWMEIFSRYIISIYIVYVNNFTNPESIHENINKKFTAINDS